MANSIEAVYMVEASPELRSTQKDLLCGPGSPSTESKAGYHSTGKYNGTPIVWTQTIKSVPTGKFSLQPTTSSSAVTHTAPRPQKDPLHRRA